MRRSPPTSRGCLPGQTATFANYSQLRQRHQRPGDRRAQSGLVAHRRRVHFKVGTTGRSQHMGRCAGADSLLLRHGAGAGGSDRLTVVWADGAIKNTWLQVTLDATGNVFYFGNAVGETGNSTANAFVSAADEIAVRTHATPPGESAGIDSAYDFNRDGKVDAADELDRPRQSPPAHGFAAADHGTGRRRAQPRRDVRFAHRRSGRRSDSLRLSSPQHRQRCTHERLAGRESRHAQTRQADVVGDGDNLLEMGEVWRYTNTLTVTQQQLNAGIEPRQHGHRRQRSKPAPTRTTQLRPSPRSKATSSAT